MSTESAAGAIDGAEQPGGGAGKSESAPVMASASAAPETTEQRIWRLETELEEARMQLAGEQNDDWITTGTAAHILGVSRPVVIRLIAAGVLGCRRLNVQRKVWLPDVLRHRDVSTGHATR